MAEKKSPSFIFDFEKLKRTFTEICPDFVDETNYEQASISRRFAEEMIFEHSKEAKVAKTKKEDTHWTFILNTKNSEGGITKNIIRTDTYFVQAPPQHQPFLMRGHLQLTFKQASLLAVYKYCQLVSHQVERDQIVLTPLAGAVFNKDDLPKLAKALNESLSELVMSVISSCQTDGYYLEHSRCHIAVAVLTKTIADLKMRFSLVRKTLKMYKLQGKSFDTDKFKIFSEFLKNASVPTKRHRDAAVDDEIDQLVSQILGVQMVSDEKPKSSDQRKMANFEKKYYAK